MKYLLVFIAVLLHGYILCGQETRLANTLNCMVGHITTEISFVSANTVRVFKYRGTAAPLKNSLTVLNNKKEVVHTMVSETDDAWAIRSAAIIVMLNKQNGIVTFFDNNKARLLAEQSNEQPFRKIDDSITNISQSFALRPDEAVYGLGQHQNGVLNQRDQTILLKQRNMDIAIPFLQSTKGYGIYWDNYSATIYASHADGISLSSEAGNCIDYYFIAGKTADVVIDGYRKLTGTAPMFPLWSYGYIQSRERYQSQEQVVDVVRRYRQLHVPIDAVVQDWQYWGEDNKNWNAVSFDSPRYPDPVAMIDSVHAMHARIMISVWPSFGSSAAIYKELDAKKLLFGFTTFPETGSVKVYDAFNPQARDIYWRYMNHNLFAKGIDGWWLDATEPEQKNISAVQKSDTFGTAAIKHTATYLGNYKSYTNAFPFETVNGVYQHQRGATNDKRVFILTRSAFAGQQRSANMVWSGDITSGWQTLKRQIPAALNYTLSGMPYWNADIGGFFSGTNYPEGNKDLLYQELYLRWLQFGVFTAMMRSHGTNTPREIYQFGRPGEVAFDVIRKYIGLRYRLEPYIYSNAWAITSKNASLMRPLVMDYPGDKNVYNMATEYLFGRSILVAPVTDSIFAKGCRRLDTTSGVKEHIYLPKGSWYAFETNEKITGGRWIGRSFTLSQMPVFIKAGTILPVADEAQYSSILNFKTLNINIYPGKDAVFELYEDQGDNYNYEHGEYSVITLNWNDKSRMLTVQNRIGRFPGMAQRRILKVSIAGVPHTRIIRYNGEEIHVHF